MTAFYKSLAINVFFLCVLTQITSQNIIELQPVASGYNVPIALAHHNNDKIYVVEKAGVIQIVDTLGNKNAESFLLITGLVNE